MLRAGDRGGRAYDGEAGHEGQAAGEQPQRRATAEGPVAAAFVEEGPYPTLERALTAHGDRGREPDRDEGPGHRHKLTGIVGVPLARRDHAIVAGGFAFDPEAMEGEPGQRMEPVNGGRQPTR